MTRSEEVTTLLTITRHIALVRANLLKIARELEARADVHDLSKLKEDEFDGFVQINRVAREHPYGSGAYKASLKAVSPSPVKLHHSRNSHHPNHHPNGVADMGLIDFIEMVVDWKAASETYGQTSFADSLEVSMDRFKFNESQIFLALLIANELQRN